MTMARETDASLVKPLEGSLIRRFTAGSTIEAGEAVAMASDGYVDPADASDGTLAFALGIALQDVVVGQRLDVVTFGPVLCLSGATPGSTIYLGDTAGEPSEAVGTEFVVLGVAESATVLFVRPQVQSTTLS
jgi:hypothetical protein